MRRRAFLGAMAVGTGGLLARRLRPAPRSLDGERLVERWSWAMGQSVHLRLFAVSEDAGFEAASAAFAELRRVEAALSRFDVASDLVALNERAGRGPVRVGADLLAVLRQAEAARRATLGAFNPAVEPLMRAWGFHVARTTRPGEAELREAVRSVREARIRLGADTAALDTREASLDLGGIGVGYGLDRAVLVLRHFGIARALLEISGDLIAIGTPPGRSGWPVEVVSASDSPGSLPRVVRLRDAALATSANTVSVVHYQDLTVGHVMDPLHGTPARALAQATVIARSGVAADVWSTAALVSGRLTPPA